MPPKPPPARLHVLFAKFLNIYEIVILRLNTSTYNVSNNYNVYVHIPNLFLLVLIVVSETHSAGNLRTTK